MSYLGELCLRRIVLARQRYASSEPRGQNSADFASYIQWQYQSSEQLFAKYPNLDVRGKSVLEIGCGTGGRAAYLAASGAARVVGIDINAEEIAIARQVVPQLYPQAADVVEYLVSAESERLPIGAFDVVVLVDCMEHVVSPPAMLRLARDYTAADGVCYFSCIGYYHRHGSHTGLMPFVNVLFSDETILNVTRWWVSREDYAPMRFDSDPPVERWLGVYDLRDRPGEHLNKLTLRDMKKLTRHSVFRQAKITIVGFGSSRRYLRALDWLRYVPWVQEVFHSYVVVELRR